MMIRVSNYGRHYSHRAPLAGMEDAAPPSALPLPTPGMVFGAVAGVGLAIPLVVAVGHRLFVRGSTAGKAAKVGLMAAGVLYLIGTLGTAGIAAGATGVVRSGV